MKGTIFKFLKWNLIQVVNDDMFCPLKNVDVFVTG